MAGARPEFVFKFERRGLFYTLFALAVLSTVWVALVLFGESQDWGDDPGRWSGVPTVYWAILAVLLLALFIVYSLAVLVIRERPGRVYHLPDSNEPAPATTPSFLQPASETPAPDSPPPGQP